MQFVFSPQRNGRVTRDTDQIIEPANDPNAFRKSVRELAAKQILITRAKQKEQAQLKLNSFGRIEGGPGGFGEPIRNRGYYGVNPPIAYSYVGRPDYGPIYNDRFKFRNLGTTKTSNIPYSNIPAQQIGIFCPPKNINIR